MQVPGRILIFQKQDMLNQPVVFKKELFLLFCSAETRHSSEQKTGTWQESGPWHGPIIKKRYGNPGYLMVRPSMTADSGTSYSWPVPLIRYFPVAITP